MFGRNDDHRREKYCSQTPRPVGRPPDFAQRIATAQAEVAVAQADLDTALERQTQAKAAVLGITQILRKIGGGPSWASMNVNN
jgi:hypothetical protein